MQRTRASLLAVFGTTTLALLPAIANAEPPAKSGPLVVSEQESVAKHKRATELYESGLASYERGNMALALLDFRRSYELDSDFHVQYNIGLCARRLGHEASAARAFEKYLKDGDSSISKARFDEVVGYLSTLQGTTASLVLTVDQGEAEVFLDGERIGTAPMPEVRVEPGLHLVLVDKPGFEPVRRSVSFSGGHEEVINVHLAPKVPPTSQGQSTLPLWISWGVTGAGLATTIALSVGASAVKRASPDAWNTPEDTALYDRAISARYTSQTLSIGADVAGIATFASSVVAIALTVAHFVNRGSEEKPVVAKGVWFDGNAMRGRF